MDVSLIKSVEIFVTIAVIAGFLGMVSAFNDDKKYIEAGLQQCVVQNIVVWQKECKEKE